MPRDNALISNRINEDDLLSGMHGRSRGTCKSRTTRSTWRADDLNNATAAAASRVPSGKSTKGSKASDRSRRVSDSESKNNAREQPVIDVEIWAPRAFFRTIPWTASLMGREEKLLVAGTPYTVASTLQRTRPSSAPATVKKLQLTSRPALQRYRPIITTPRSRPFQKQKSKSRITPAREKPQTNEQQSTHGSEDKPENAKATPRRIPHTEETNTRERSKKRKSASKKKAEMEMRRLLSEGCNTVDTSLRITAYLEPSPVPELPGTVCFKGTPSDKCERGLASIKGKKLTVQFTGVASTPVRLAFLKAGFRATTSPTKWNVLWGVTPKPGTFEKMNKCLFTPSLGSKAYYALFNCRFQRVNHFPGSGELGRKDKLYRSIKQMQRREPAEDFNFMPKSFLLPEDRVELRQELAKHKGRRYIVKPVASACGRGIRITLNPSVFTCARECIVQRYITRPMTIDGFKFDLRVYVGVTSYTPLRVYIYDDGLVRFATKPYTAAKTEIDDRFVHITNTSVNRRNDRYIKNCDAEKADVGSKWSLQAFRAYVTKHRLVEWSRIWTQVHAIVAKTFRCVEDRMREHLRDHRVPYSTSCFEILGFDILLDTSYRAWLLEVNTFPDLAGTSPLDQKLKTELIEDMMHMIGVIPRCRTPGNRGGSFEEPSQQLLAEMQRRGGWEPAVPSYYESITHYYARVTSDSRHDS